MSLSIIRTVDLSKRYDKLVAVDSLNLEIREGEVFGLLGPNGAGKWTGGDLNPRPSACEADTVSVS